jgi:uncharacterized membrane protein YeaQ/YmgE (transglycosylase-associated protein family)
VSYAPLILSFEADYYNSWLDTTPISRVVVRLTEDIQAIDGPFAQSLDDTIFANCALLSKLAAIVTSAPVFIIPSIFVGVIGALIGQTYIRAQLCIKREHAKAKGPILSVIGATIHGLRRFQAPIRTVLLMRSL